MVYGGRADESIQCLFFNVWSRWVDGLTMVAGTWIAGGHILHMHNPLYYYYFTFYGLLVTMM